MKTLLATSLSIIFVFVATIAYADHGRGGYDSYYSKGDRIERHLDRTGDRIERHFDRKADRAEAKGKYRKADRLRDKGDRIDRHLDRKGDRFHARHDDRKWHKHYKKHRRHHPHGHDYGDYRHYHARPHVVYRSHDPYDTYFGLVINQPGLWLGWGWYD